MGRVLFLVNHHMTIYNLRRELIECLLQRGYDVYVSSPYGKRIDDLCQMGCKHVEVKLDRHGTNLVSELRLLKHYVHIMRDIKPDIVLTYTVKPNIYGCLACRILRIPSIANVTGLGIALANGGIMEKLLMQLYRVAFGGAGCVFFQNKENERFFINRKVHMRRHMVIPGSGVSLNQHCFEDYPKNDSVIQFLYVGRVMKDKGIEELIAAARSIKENHGNVEFAAIGFCEDDYREKADELGKLGIIRFHGVKDDVHEYIKNCHAVVLPSYHEGMANVLLEAASTGRPVLASNIPGCQETFDEGVSGLGFQPKDPQSLTEALARFIGLPWEQKRAMGIAGRHKMEREFDRNIVMRHYLEEIDRITG